MIVPEALAHVSTWIFDLDQTLYPAEAEVMALIEGQMTTFVARETGLPPAEAHALQKRYLSEHGTTLAGLMAHHNIDPYAFLNEVHDVSLDKLHPDPALNALIGDLPGRKVVFTNGDERHATRILDKLEMDGLFDGVFHLEHARFIPKPNLVTFERMMAAHDVTATQAAFFEDSPKNLKPAFELGMKTILVGPKAIGNEDAFVDFRSPDLKTFLADTKNI
ncbi:pyrimidine 5'-nucleotidase [Asticcacaulis sp. EMRT-3]|uniref:pyrimidine 5'-nucleotidase n=1 Tax=Asticcacaulis sp. EMRT-3 TaxID=3040349 RepID=UPI0024AFF1C8|nr:pyrimidine 5'-nucleotidase [Asticcacaulis sp. EMRT-3]MDI7773861.1 pyrimidine 5'-nucleotidase [Asticcacaulis sp. EMRT-3]